MIRKRGNTYTISVELPRGPGGKRRRKWFTADTKKAALQLQAEQLTSVAKGSFVERSRLTVAEFLERWLRHIEGRVADKTFERYREIVNRNLIPAFGGFLLTHLEPIDIEGFYAEALRSGRKDGKGGLSAQSVLHFHRVLRGSLHQAVKWQLLVRNPADAIEPPKPERKEMQILDETETAWLLTCTEGTGLYLPVLLETTLGIRRGEVFALRWEDLDLVRGVASIRRSLQQTNAGLKFKSPKNGKGRSISLPQFTIDALRTHKHAQAQERAVLGAEYSEHDLVCCRADGNPWPPDSFSAEFRRFRDKAGLKIRYHDLRHTHASHLLRQGVHPKVVSERLGHSTVGITLDTYSHVLPGLQEEAAQKVDLALKTALAQIRKPLSV